MSEDENEELPSAAESSEKGSEDLKKRLAEAEEEKKEAHEKYLRTYAEFENFKKRTAKEQSEQARYANERLLLALLPVLDNLARAISHTKESKNLEKLIEGVDLTQKELLSVLNKFGVTVIESLGRFDPAHHQAMLQVETDDQEENTVVDEFQKGYLLHGRVLRPALVSVAKGKNKEDPPLSEKEADKTSIEEDP
jgi:molecular chaperone GrpE